MTTTALVPSNTDVTLVPNTVENKKAIKLAQTVLKAPVVDNQIQLLTVDETLAWLPKLQVIEEMTVKGVTYREDGLAEDVSVPIDNGYKLAGHVASDGIFHACPWMKSESYSETAHDFVLGKVSESLNDRGIKHGVWRSMLTRNMACMRTDLLMEQRYKINEDAFEDGLGVLYNNGELKSQYAIRQHDRANIGVYQPCVTLINSFFGSSQILFSLLRIVCLNGLHRIADSLTLTFAHMESNLLQKFSDRSNIFLDKIFAGKEIENLIMNMQKDEMMISMFLEWLLDTAGKKAADAVFEQFNIENNFHNLASDHINKWVAYNMMTWAASHIITCQLRQKRMYSQFNSLPTV